MNKFGASDIIAEADEEHMMSMSNSCVNQIQSRMSHVEVSRIIKESMILEDLDYLQ